MGWFAPANSGVFLAVQLARRGNRPSASIEDSENKVLFMERGDDPIQLLGDDGEVSFKGFGAIEEILPPLLNRTLKLGDTWARWPAKPPCSLLSTGIGINIFKTSILK